MTEVHFVKRARKAISNAKVARGDSYYWWKLYGEPRQVSRYSPKRSQLTSSTFLAKLYDIEDAVEDLALEVDDENSNETLLMLDDYIIRVEALLDEEDELYTTTNLKIHETRANFCDTLLHDMKALADQETIEDIDYFCIEVDALDFRCK